MIGMEILPASHFTTTGPSGDPSDGRLVQVDPHDPRRLMAGFLAGYSSMNTRKAYERDLLAWGNWCVAHRVEWLRASRTEVDLYARALEDAGRAPASVGRALSALNAFYLYLTDEDVIVASPVRRVRRPKVSNESPRLGLDRDEARAFLRAATEAGPRDAFLARLLLTNALRVSEVCACDVADLETERGYRVLRVLGKGGKRATIPLMAGTVEMLDLYLAGRTSGPLVLDADGRRLDRHDVARIVTRLAHRAGITKRLSPHSLRHTAITGALDANVPLRDVQDLARHADPKTTRRYDRAKNNLERNAAHQLAGWFAEDGDA
jgi:integrase/recombinase XerD